LIIRGFRQWLWSFVSPSHKAYDRAYRIYEEYAKRIKLDLLEPSPDQIDAARINLKLHEARELYEAALKICRETAQWYNAAVVVYQLGLLYRLWGKPQQVISHMQESLELCQNLVGDQPHTRHTISLCNFYLAQALMQTEHSAEAKKHLEMAKALDEMLGDHRRNRAIMDMLSRCPQNAPIQQGLEIIQPDSE